jgi:3-dehydroquinate synthase
MKTTRLELILSEERRYDIRIGTGLLAQLGEQLRSVPAVAAAKRVLIVADSNTGPLYAEAAKLSLQSSGFDVHLAEFQAGEGSKGIASATALWNELASIRAGRDAMIVALGGGVVGDLAGFVAATWMRGIAYVQVPTSLLAMVDSSVGGKTAVNLDAGKNLVGCFHQPAYVLCDLDLLDTLPQPEMQNGLAEIAKASVIDGAGSFAWMKANAAALTARQKPELKEAIKMALKLKARIVVADEREGGVRECLNLGHTFGHALESVAGLGSVAHGRAVAEGMRFASRLAAEAVGAPAAFAAEQAQLLDALGLTSPLPPASAEALYDSMLSDKKARAGELRFVFARAPGDWQATAVDPDLLMIYLMYWQQAQEQGRATGLEQAQEQEQGRAQ